MKSFRIRDVARLLLITSMAITLAACGSDDNGTLFTNPSGATPSGLSQGATSPGGTPAVSSGTMQAAATELVNTYAATLSGAQVVPANSSTALGAGTIVLNPTNRQFTATLTTTGITGASASILSGATGANGNAVFNLNEATPGSGIWTLALTLTQEQVTAFTAAAGSLYFSVSSDDFPEGEIRGQIFPSAQTTAGGSGATGAGATGSGTTDTGTGTTSTFGGANTFVAALRGPQETPPTPSTAEGSTAIIVDPATLQMSVATTTIGITATAAHVHIAPPGQPGPIVFPLTETSSGSGVWTTNATLTAEQLNALQTGNYYVNVHSAAFPDGEIRGQIFPVQFGAGPSASGGAGTATGGIFTIGNGGGTDTSTTGTGITGTGTTGTT